MINYFLEYLLTGYWNIAVLCQGMLHMLCYSARDYGLFLSLVFLGQDLGSTFTTFAVVAQITFLEAFFYGFFLDDKYVDQTQNLVLYLLFQCLSLFIISYSISSTIVFSDGEGDIHHLSHPFEIRSDLTLPLIPHR